MRGRRNLYWRFNWYRHSELEGALLLGRMTRQAADASLLHQLTKHCSDEARHAWLWQRTLTTLCFPTVQIFRSYQSFYLDETPPPRSLIEVLALTHVFEQRVHARFTQELHEPAVPEAARRTYSALLRDEQSHLKWVADWLEGAVDARIHLDRFRDADERVYRRLAPYSDRIWDIPGLGAETRVVSGD